MKNKIKYFIKLILVNLFLIVPVSASEIFNFNVSNIEITQNGNIFKGYNGGEAFTNDGILIKAENFEYNKDLSTLISEGNVQLQDTKKNILIFADKINYLKNQEIIIAYGNVEFQDTQKKIIVKANKISYEKNIENITANKNVSLKDSYNDIEVYSDKITYLKNKEKIFTSGETTAKIQSKYEFVSKDVSFLRKKMELSSNSNSIITDNNFALYKLGSFVYNIENEFLKGTDISIIQNTNVTIGKSDQLFFKNGFFD